MLVEFVLMLVEFTVNIFDVFILINDDCVSIRGPVYITLLTLSDTVS